MNATTLTKIANFVWFQSIWALAIFTQYRFWYVIGGLLILFYILSNQRLRDLACMGAIMVLGTLIDSVLTMVSIFVFTGPTFFVPIPLWLVALWGAFALTLSYSLNYLQHRYAICAALGAVFGPISYWAGERFNAVEFDYSLALTLGVLAAVWAVTFPLCVWICQQTEQHFSFNSAATAKERT